MAKPLALTTKEVRAAIGVLEGFTLHQRTLQEWIQRGLVRPSTPWRQGTIPTWSSAAFARVRLIARLRRGGISAQQITTIFAYLDRELREVLQPRTTARLLVAGARAYVVRPGSPDIEVPSGQIRLDLKLDSLFERTTEFARRVRAA